jgi:hypothetical protein
MMGLKACPTFSHATHFRSNADIIALPCSQHVHHAGHVTTVIAIPDPCRLQGKYCSQALKHLKSCLQHCPAGVCIGKLIRMETFIPYAAERQGLHASCSFAVGLIHDVVLHMSNAAPHELHEHASVQRICSPAIVCTLLYILQA